MSAAVVVESAPGCGGAPIVLFALEELGRPYTLVIRPNGYFLATYGAPGPRVTIGDEAQLGVGAIASLASGVDLAPWPSLVQYRDRVMARPAWTRAMTRASENEAPLPNAIR